MAFNEGRKDEVKDSRFHQRTTSVLRPVVLQDLGPESRIPREEKEKHGFPYFLTLFLGLMCLATACAGVGAVQQPDIRMQLIDNPVVGKPVRLKAISSPRDEHVEYVEIVQGKVKVARYDVAADQLQLSGPWALRKDISGRFNGAEGQFLLRIGNLKNSDKGWYHADFWDDPHKRHLSKPLNLKPEAPRNLGSRDCANVIGIVIVVTGIICTLW